MPKKIDFYYLEDAETGDVYVLSPLDRKLLGKTLEEMDAEAGGHGWTLILALKPPSARLDRQAKERALVGDPIMGFRRNTDFLPAAQFEVMVSAWELKPPRALQDREEEIEPPHWWKDEVIADTFEGLPPSLADKIGAAIDRHLRPRSNENPEFFTRLSPGNSAPPLETSPST